MADSFITEMRSWLAQLGCAQNADEEIEIIGIEQRLSQMTDPRIEIERWGRLMQECIGFRRAIDMRRKVLPLVQAAEGSRRGSANGGAVRGKQQTQEKAARDSVEFIGGRGNVSAIIKALAREKDEWDYPSPKDELWPRLIGDLGCLGLKAREVLDNEGNPLRIDYRDGNGETGKITFGSFKTMISTERRAERKKVK